MKKALLFIVTLLMGASALGEEYKAPKIEFNSSWSNESSPKEVDWDSSNFKFKSELDKDRSVASEQEEEYREPSSNEATGIQDTMRPWPLMQK